jgi:predicted RND superfamily exporter protein
VERFARIVVRHRKAVIVLFIVALIVSIPLISLVKTNYNMVDYLPTDAPSTRALAVMSEEFSQNTPNTRVMVPGLSIPEALAMKQSIDALDGVTAVLWLDDTIDLKLPLSEADPSTIEAFYRGDTALYSVTIAPGREQEATAALRALVGTDGAVAGDAPSIAAAQFATASETMKAFAIGVVAVIIILILFSASWLEPLLFLVAIGVSILINMGTNVIFGEISFITKSVSPILQLACSLDYAVFLLHSFARNRLIYPQVEVAMVHAIKESFSTVAASATTTLFGFLALVFMNFQIGADLGINLTKGIILSFITVMVLLPALTLSCYKLMDRLTHRPLMPTFKGVYRVTAKAGIIVALAVLVAVVPSFFGQRHAEFLYGNENAVANTQAGEDARRIAEQFGQSTLMVMLVPSDDRGREAELCSAIKEVPHVTSIISYSETVGATIPPGFLDSSITDQFFSAHYSRIIIYLDTPVEGDLAFSTVVLLREVADAFYGDEALTLGQSTNLYDMKLLVQEDNVRVTLVAALAIFCVLLLTFRSLIIPLLLLLTIESAIWINLAIPYFTGTPINFIGYLILSTVQLGATVDYAILLTTNYCASRRTMEKRQAIHVAVGGSFRSILVSATTLAIAGFVLFAVSTNAVISDIGLLLFRGTILSFVLVTCFLPALLTVFDRVIAKTMWRPGFVFSEKRKS